MVANVWQAEGNLQEPVLCSHGIGPGDPIPPFHGLSQLASPTFFFFFKCFDFTFLFAVVCGLPHPSPQRLETFLLELTNESPETRELQDFPDTSTWLVDSGCACTNSSLWGLLSESVSHV